MRPLAHYLRHDMMRSVARVAIASPFLGSISINPYPLLSRILNLIGAFTSRYGLRILTPALLTISLSASAVVFFYPLEIETRESTVWLCVLALRQGINIYDHSRVAFTNMNHGPFDPLFKYLIAMLFPFLESWQVTRFTVFLLPYVFLLVAWKVIVKSSRRSRLHALFLGSIGYLFLMVVAKELLFVGRSDATAAVLLLLLMCISITFSPRIYLTTALHGFVTGAIGISLILTNWRIAPTAVAVVLFTLWIYKYINRTTGRHMLIYFISCVIVAIGIWCFIIYYMFNFNLSLYYKHFFGFYSKGVGLSGFPYNGSVISFLVSLFNPIGPRDAYKGGPLLLALAVYILAGRNGRAVSNAWVLLSVFVFIACSIAYYLNYWGGGTWYFIPFLIILWFYLCVHYPTIAQWRLTLVGICVLALMCVNLRTVVFPTLKRAIRMDEAYSFAILVRSLQQTNNVLSEDTFFFRTSYHGEVIDMGDFASIAAENSYFGEEFNRSVLRHFAQTESYPPDYILTGLSGSPELRKLIAEKYNLIAEGPHNLSATYFNSSKLFVRRDLLTP